MTRRQQQIVTGLVVLVLGYMVWAMLLPLLRWWNTGGYPEGPWFERESSPDGPARSSVTPAASTGTCPRAMPTASLARQAGR